MNILNDTSLEHFKREVKILEKSVPENDKLIIAPYIKELKKIFEIHDKQNYHIGLNFMVADVIARTIQSTLYGNVLSPLTGEDDEWVTTEIDGVNYTQNVRDFGVFKEGNDVFYNKAIMWVREGKPHAGEINGIKSTQKVKEFPFMPRTFYVEVSETEILDTETLNQAFEYYEKSI